MERHFGHHWGRASLFPLTHPRFFPKILNEEHPGFDLTMKGATARWYGDLAFFRGHPLLRQSWSSRPGPDLRPRYPGNPRLSFTDRLFQSLTGERALLSIPH